MPMGKFQNVDLPEECLGAAAAVGFEKGEATTEPVESKGDEEKDRREGYGRGMREDWGRMEMYKMGKGNVARDGRETIWCDEEASA